MNPQGAIECKRCEGHGTDPEPDVTVEWECCSDFLPTGECCAAVYGLARMVPVQALLPKPCNDCGGYGEAPA